MLRVCAEMVRNSETIPRLYQERVFSSIYWFSRQDAEIREHLLKVLDIQDHLKMYQTLYGPGVGSTSLSQELVRDYWMATLLERAGMTGEALTIYRKVKSRFDQESKKNSMYRENYIQATEDAIRRLSSSH